MGIVVGEGSSLLLAAGPAAASIAPAILPDHGGSSTSFQIRLPVGAKCSGDTLTGGYHTYSYVVDDETLPASQLPTLTFNPSQANQGVSLVDTSGTPYEANATGPDSGTVNGLPAFDWSVYVGETGSATDTPPKSLLYGHVYNVGIACVTTTGTMDSTNFWNTQFTFAAASTSTAGDFTWTAVQVPTTTTLSAAPGGSAAPGAAVALTATISPASAPGTVTFMDGTKTIGSGPVPIVVNAGVATASISTGSLTDGSHSLTAVYTPTDYKTQQGGGPFSSFVNIYAGSTSAAIPYSITAAATTTTTTTTSTTTNTSGTTSTTSTTTGSTSGGSSTANPSSSATSGTGALAVTGSPIEQEVVVAALVVVLGLFVLSFGYPGRRPARRP